MMTKNKKNNKKYKMTMMIMKNKCLSSHVHIRHEIEQSLNHHPPSFLSAQLLLGRLSLSLSTVENCMLLFTDPV